MSEDLVRQAELRHQRRPRSARGTAENEEILVLNPDTRNTKSSGLASLPSGTALGKSLPPIRCHGNQENNAPPRSTSSDLLSPRGEEKTLTPRRRAMSPCSPNSLGGFSDLGPSKSPCLPLIKCKINNKDVKALLSTGSVVSTINRHASEQCNLPRSTTMAAVIVADESFQVALSPSDTGMHDVVLGIDFITEHNCILDFKNRKLSLGSATSVSFLMDNEIPLKFRQRQPLTASM